MRKETLLGMEVYYEDKPVTAPRPAGLPSPNQNVPKGVWVFGDSDEDEDEDYFDNYPSEVTDYGDFTEPESHPIPIKGRIYSVDGLNITAKLKEIRPLTKTAGILEMSHHDNIFYINPGALRKASPEQVADYLEESDYNNTP